MNNKTTYVFTVLLTLSSGCTSLKYESNQTGIITMNLKNTKPYCIGRYTMDIPAEAIPLRRYDQYDSFIIKVKVNAKRIDFDLAIDEIRKKYSKGDWHITDDLNEQIYEGRLTKILKGKSSRANGDPYDVYGFVLDNRNLFLIEGNHSDMPKWTEESNEAIQHVIRNLRYRSEQEIPKDSGQCIYHGFITDDDQRFRHSKQTLGFEFKNYPTVVLRFESETNTRSTSELIPRIEDKLMKVGQSTRQINKDNIRKGEKNTIHLAGQEWLSIEKMKGKNGISALWEHTGSAQNNKDPLINFEVDTSYTTPGNQSSSLEQFEAIKLYESIVNSIRKF